MPEPSPSALIIRLDAIGDALALTPAIAALRRRSIPVDLVLSPANLRVFAPKALRRAIVADFALRGGTRANATAIDRFGAALRANDYSHVFVATEDRAGYRLAAAVGAGVRIGFEDLGTKPLKALWSRRLLTTTVHREARLRPRSEHECQVLFRLIAPLAAAVAPTRDPSELRPLVLETEPERVGRIAVQITDKWERLGIGFDAVVELVRRVATAGDVQLLSSRAESRYAQAIERATAIAVTCFEDLEPWKSAIGAAEAIVTPDCGALHVAGMLGTPVVAIFPDNRTYGAQIARWAPWAAPHRLLRAAGNWPVRAVNALVELLAV